MLTSTIRNYARAYAVDLPAAVAEVHRANLSKLGDDGQPVMRPDGKVLKGSNFRAPDMRCAVVSIRDRAIHDDFTVPLGANPEPPPWWLDGITGSGS